MNETIAMVNEVPLRDEVYYRMLSTDIDERVELLWCGVQYYSSIWIATTLERGRMVPSWGGGRSERHHHHRDTSSSSLIRILCFNACIRYQTTKNHIK